MFTHFEERDKEQVVIRQMDSIALQHLVDYIYTSKIIITEENVVVCI